MFCRCLENLGSVGVVVVRCFSFFSFKRASRSHAKTGSFSMVFSVFFLRLFLEGFFLVFLWFCEVLKVPLEVIFGIILDKIEVFIEKVGPSFLHTLTAFWLDFQGPGLPGRLKKREKNLRKIEFFLN